MFHYLITTLIDYVFCGLILFRKNNRTSFSAALGAFCLGTWSLELFFLSYIQDVDLLVPIFHLSRWGMFFIPFPFALFSYQLLTEKSKLYKNIVLVPGFLSCLASCLMNFFVFPSTLVEAEAGFLPEPDFLFYWFLVNFTYLSVSGIVYIAVKYKKSSKRDKQRIKWLGVALFMLLLVGWLSSILFIRDSYFSKYSGVVANLIFTSIFFYGSNENQLVSPKLLLADGVAYSVLLGVYVLAFFACVSYFPVVGFSLWGFLFIFIYLMVFSQTYPKLSKIFVPKIRKILSRVNYDYEFEKAKIREELQRSSSFSDVLNALDNLFYTGIQVENYKLFIVGFDGLEWIGKGGQEAGLEVLPNDSLICQQAKVGLALTMRDETYGALNDELEKYRAECFVPIVSDGEILAIVTVGPLLNKTYYLFEDVYLLNWLSVELGHVIKVIISSGHVLHDLNEAKKTLSVIGVMNQYHHDIKVPLAIIDGVVSTNIYTPEKQREIVLEQVERGTKMIAMMATMLRGKRTRTLAPLILANIIVDSLSLFKSRFNNVDTEFEAESEVVGDAVDLKILFINLIKNSAEAGGVGRSLDLKIRTWEEYNSVYIAFSDSGVGMTKRQCDTLWEEGATTKANGSGIGLQAIKRIAGEHNATIRVESKVNVGTTFTLRFVCS